MRKNWKSFAAVCLTGGLVMAQLAGCGAKTVETELPASTAEMGENADMEGAGTDREKNSPGNLIKEDDLTMTAQLAEGKSKTVQYLPEDLDAEWDESAVTGIVMEDSGIIVDGSGARAEGAVAVIEEAGTYVVSGEMSEGQIRIEADDDAVVRLVLNGIQLSNTVTAPIYGAEKCKVILTLAPGTENTVRDGDTYQYETEGEDEPDAPVFVKGDLTINGTGKLEVLGNYQSGIRSKGSLTVVSGVISIDAQDDGLKGKDAVIIRDGVLDIKSVKDAIKSNQDKDEEQGFIWIDGGNITIAAQDDGIQAETALIVTGGNITITESQEGLAGKTVDILGGLIRANASDDSINSAASVETEQEKMQDQEGVYTRIAGGEIWLNAFADGIDSNGDLYIEGGTLYLSGPTGGGDGILDYNGTGTISGGTVFAAGSTGMMQTFGDDSTQNYLVVYYTEPQKGGTAIRLLDSSEKELGSYTPEKDYQAVIISSPDIQAGSTYRVETGKDTAELAVSGTVTIYGTASGGPGGRNGGGNSRDGGGNGGGNSGGNSRNGGGGMGRHDGADAPDGKQKPGGAQPPEGVQEPDGETPPN